MTRQAPASFQASYLLESSSEFGSSLKLELCVDTMLKRIRGICHVQRGPVQFDLELDGGYSELARQCGRDGEGGEQALQVNLVGNPRTIPLRDSALLLKMRLTPDWKAGRADYHLFSRKIDDALVRQDDKWLGR
ncbi:DUF1842 domain-containing protein [Undibacterium terreum]|nr:DUF1842 domain-containing protein [Undibacterium terreum]